jgi:hypothetical protein
MVVKGFPQMQCDDFASAYRFGLQRLLADGAPVPSVRDPTSVASHFGVGDRPSIELLGYGFEIPDVVPCVLDSSAWKFNLAYAMTYAWRPI